MPTVVTYPSPILVYPDDGQFFWWWDVVQLQWQPVGTLPPDVYYVPTLTYSHYGETWTDETPWTKDTSWIMSEHGYLLSLSDDDIYHWSVQVMRQTGVDASGRPVGYALSPMSAVRMLTWRAPGPSPHPSPNPTDTPIPP